MRRPRILLADDHFLLLEGYRKLLEAEALAVEEERGRSRTVDLEHEAGPTHAVSSPARRGGRTRS